MRDVLFSRMLFSCELINAPLSLKVLSLNFVNSMIH